MWVNAFVYMLIGRMIYFFIPSHQIFGIKGIKIAKIFVWLAVIFLTQVGGGVMIEPATTTETGIHTYMGGIGFQELCILIFTSIAIKFLLLLMRTQTRSQMILSPRQTNWRKILFVYAMLVLITVRIIFRMVEFAAGLDPRKNPMPYHGSYFMYLDALPMF